VGSTLGRRDFLGVIAAVLRVGGARVAGAARGKRSGGGRIALPKGWVEAGREFSLGPFWFWNDQLSEGEIVRQLDDFCAHGVKSMCKQVLLLAKGDRKGDIEWPQKIKTRENQGEMDLSRIVYRMSCWHR